MDFKFNPSSVFGNEKLILGSKFVMLYDKPQMVRVIYGDVDDVNPSATPVMVDKY